MILSRHNDQYWKTTDFYLAAYVYAQGGDLVGVEGNSHEVIYSFVDSEKLQRSVWEFQSATEATIDARLFASAIETLETERRQCLMEHHARTD